MTIELWLLSSAGALVLARFIYRKRLSHLERGYRWRQRFLRAAGPIIDDPEVPRDLAIMMMSMTRQIRSASDYRSLIWALLKGALDRREVDPAFDQSMKSLSPERHRQVGEAVMSFIVAVSYRSWLLGPIFRRLTIWPIRPDSQAGSEVALDTYVPQVKRALLDHDRHLQAA